MKTITNITYPAFALFALACFALSPGARAVTPAPDGGYPNQNTAEGEDALFSLTSGVSNTAVGFEALFSNTTGYDNTATGGSALFSNTTGYDNTATGVAALFSNTTGNDNAAAGASALISNTTGNDNTATGGRALFSNTTGYDNTATGFQALIQNSTGYNNTAYGDNTLVHNTIGNYNIAIGHLAGFSIGAGSNNIDIGTSGASDESNTIRIGTQGTQTAAYIAGIWQGTITGSNAPVRVNSSGKLGTTPSSARFKEAIQPMDKASEAILALKPVTFRYKKELDPKGAPQFGLVAEEVAKVNPDLVVVDEQGKPFTVRYEEVNAMLLNEFLKEHKTVQEQGATIGRQQKQIDALTAGLQKVSAQLEASKPAPQMVNNP